eukprot:COSAG03_NODE_2430_length_2780_cov_35.434526_3_plen_21_part_01
MLIAVDNATYLKGSIGNTAGA